MGASRAASPSAASYEFSPDRLQAALGPNYELGRLLGRGGYAEVFTVRDLRLKRELALKVLRPDLILTDTLVARFRREAEAVALLQHPNILPVYDVGEADGVLWLLMPLVQGETVKTLLAREQRLPVDEVRRILLEASQALQTAHEAGVVHRDIKPENLMIEGKTQRVILMDFGIAKAMDSSVENSLTGTGVVIGTPQYMSPEQAMGKHIPDPRSDQYSLAVVGYQMLTGRVPFEGDNVREVLVKQLLEEPTPLSRVIAGIPPALSSSIHQALRKEPKLRFASMSAFGRALSGEHVPASEGGAVRRDSSFNIPTRRRPWLAAAAWIVILAGAAVAARRAGLFPAVPVEPVTAPPAAPPRRPAAGTPRPAPGPRPGAPGAPVAAVDSAPPPPPPAAPAATCTSAFAAGEWAVAFAECTREADTSAAAHRNLGLLYSAGHGVERNERAAALHLTLAADSTDTIAVLEMARRYAEGRGVTQSDSKAAGKLLLAANLGVTEAYPEVADRYDTGRGFQKDARQAALWFRRAADAGHVPSMTRLALALLDGKGVKKDEAEAVSWLNTAASKQNAEAEYQIAMMLLKGKVMREDPLAGREWLKRAADHGHPAAKQEMAKRGW